MRGVGDFCVGSSNSFGGPKGFFGSHSPSFTLVDASSLIGKPVRFPESPPSSISSGPPPPPSRVRLGRLDPSSGSAALCEQLGAPIPATTTAARQSHPLIPPGL